jgi:hypothetical protein
MAHGVDAAVERVQCAAGDATVNRPVAQPQAEQLTA